MFYYSKFSGGQTLGRGSEVHGSRSDGFARLGNLVYLAIVLILVLVFVGFPFWIKSHEVPIL
jgi:hypothetical protein